MTFEEIHSAAYADCTNARAAAYADYNAAIEAANAAYNAAEAPTKETK